MDLLIIALIISAAIAVITGIASIVLGDEVWYRLSMFGIIFAAIFCIFCVLSVKTVHLDPAKDIYVAKTPTLVHIEARVNGEHRAASLNDIFIYQNVEKTGYSLFYETQYNHFGRSISGKFVLVKE